MIAPDGSTGDIPTNRVQDAVGAGFKMATAMTSPDGRLGYIPSERASEARAAGFKMSPTGNTANIGTQTGAYSSDAGTPVNLITGEGGMQAAQHQAQQVIGGQAEQMHGAGVGVSPSGISRPPMSIAGEKGFENNLTSPPPTGKDAPANMSAVAHIGESIPALAGAAMAGTPTPWGAEGFADTVQGIGQDIKGIARKVLLDPVTGQPTVGPTSIATRVLRTPEEIEAARQATLDQAHEDFAKKVQDIEAARQKELAAWEKLKQQHAQSLNSREAEPEQPFSGVKVPDTNQPSVSPQQSAPTPYQSFVQRQAQARPQAPFQGISYQEPADKAVTSVVGPTPAQQFAARQAADRPVSPPTPFQGTQAPNLTQPNVGPQAPGLTPAQEFAARQAASATQPVTPPAKPFQGTTYQQPSGNGTIPIAGPTPAQEFAERQAQQVKLKDVMQGTPTNGEGGSGSPDDLISRTRALVKPGEEPTAADIKRAGDLTQAPLTRLKQLAKWGDRLAQNEINRRLKNP
jgi:hypothetical protein